MNTEKIIQVMSDLIYSIEDFFNSYLKKDDKRCVIPGYQRGYKWTADAINKLVKDIQNFDVGEDSEKFYCLQNITLVADSSSPNDFNVVDGQQRITTIIVILSCLGEIERAKNRIKYPSRTETTQKFIDEMILEPANKSELLQNLSDDKSAWDILIKNHNNYNHQDIFYLFSAYRTVTKFISQFNDENKLNSFKTKFLENVKLIVNLLQNVDEKTLFSHLNGGRVQLDGADLVRAMIITDVSKNMMTEESDLLKKAVQINEARSRIGLQIDSIMQWWKIDEHYNYWSPVVKNIRLAEGSIDFDSVNYRISVLYKLYSIIKAWGSKVTFISMDLFENAEKEILWKDIFKLQRVLTDWYNDIEIYHLVMFVILYGNDWLDDNNKKESTAEPTPDPERSFKFLYEKWWSLSGRKAFISLLKEMIYKTIINHKAKIFMDDSMDKDACLEFCKSERWYEDSFMDKVMILLDIIKYNTRKQERLSAEFFKSNNEDREHIFPQTPLGGKISNKDNNKVRKVIEEYLNFVNNSLTEKIEMPTDEVLNTPELRAKYESETNDRIKKVVPLDSLGNLCLLDAGTNRSYGNEFYTQKRISILSAQSSGRYIRPHVLDAFDKVWRKAGAGDLDMESMKSWTTKDIIERRQYIDKQLKDFLKDQIKESQNDGKDTE